MTNHNSNIDQLRAIGVLLVLLQHSLTVVIRHPDTPTWFADYIFNFVTREYISVGQIGVVIFFLTSGYLVPWSIKQPNAGINYVVTRVFRLYPAYWVSLVCLTLYFLISGDRTISLSTFLINLTMLQKAVGVPDVNLAYWTLFIELLFYCIAFSMFKLNMIKNDTKLIAMIIACSAWALLASVTRFVEIPSVLPVSYVSLLATILLGTLMRNQFERTGKIVNTTVMVVFAIVFILSIPAYWLAYYHTPEVASWKAMAFSQPVAFCIFVTILSRKVVSRPWLANIGLWSYSLYLFHDLPINVSKRLFYSLSWEVAAPAIILFVWGSSILIAVTAYYLIEKPFIVLGKSTAAAINNRFNQIPAGGMR